MRISRRRYPLLSTATLHSTLALNDEAGPVCICVACVRVVQEEYARFSFANTCARMKMCRFKEEHTDKHGSKSPHAHKYQRCVMQDRHQERAGTWSRCRQTQHTRLGAILAAEPVPVRTQRLESKWSSWLVRCRHQHHMQAQNLGLELTHPMCRILQMARSQHRPRRRPTRSRC